MLALYYTLDDAHHGGSETDLCGKVGVRVYTQSWGRREGVSVVSVWMFSFSEPVPSRSCTNTLRGRRNPLRAWGGAETGMLTSSPSFSWQTVSVEEYCLGYTAYFRLLASMRLPLLSFNPPVVLSPRPTCEAPDPQRSHSLPGVQVCGGQLRLQERRGQNLQSAQQ